MIAYGAEATRKLNEVENRDEVLRQLRADLAAAAADSSSPTALAINTIRSTPCLSISATHRAASFTGSASGSSTCARNSRPCGPKGERSGACRPWRFSTP